MVSLPPAGWGGLRPTIAIVVLIVVSSSGEEDTMDATRLSSRDFLAALREAEGDQYVESLLIYTNYRRASEMLELAAAQDHQMDSFDEQRYDLGGLFKKLKASVVSRLSHWKRVKGWFTETTHKVLPI